ncbi:MAG: hypothetical protein D6694_09125 [Gammaproteobacteria bacterium]|nr:MAG: hypothetical protein D6694_09125 [Gammaproteobacteria bacterium]
MPRAKFKNLKKTTPIRVPQEVSGQTIQFAQIMDSIAGQDGLLVECRVINVKQGQGQGAEEAVVKTVRFSLNSLNTLAVPAESTPAPTVLTQPVDEAAVDEAVDKAIDEAVDEEHSEGRWEDEKDEDEDEDEDELEVEEFRAIALAMVTGLSNDFDMDEWNEDEEEYGKPSKLEGDFKLEGGFKEEPDEEPDEPKDDCNPNDLDDLDDYTPPNDLDNDLDDDLDDYAPHEHEENPDHAEDNNVPPSPLKEAENLYPFYPEKAEKAEEAEETFIPSSSPGGSFNLTPALTPAGFDSEKTRANLMLMQTATQASQAQASQTEEEACGNTTTSDSEDSDSDSEPKPEPAARMEEFARKLFKHWRMLVINRGDRDYWGQKVDLGDIHSSGFKSTNGVMFLYQVGVLHEARAGIKLPCGCKMELHAEGKSSYKIRGKEYGSISFSFPSQQAELIASDEEPIEEPIDSEKLKLPSTTINTIPRLEPKPRQQQDPLLQKLFKFFAAAN